jgi:O-antigen/teichoic acid export membrane protein
MTPSSSPTGGPSSSTAAGSPVTPDILDGPAAGPVALRGSALRTAGYMVGILLSLISAPLLVRHLGVAEFGRYVTVISLVTIISGLTEGGLNSVVLREYSTLRGARRAALMGSAIGVRIVLTVFGVALAVVFAIGAGYPRAMVLGTAAAGAGLVFQLLQSLLSLSLQSELRFGWASAADLLRQVVSVVLIVVLVLTGGGLVSLLAVAIPASAISLVFTVAVLTDRTQLHPDFHVRRWWELLRESIPWAVVSAVNIIYFRVAIVLMSLVATAVQTGYFATSFRIVEVLVGVPALVVGAAFPILARAGRDDPARFTYVVRRLFELSVIVGAWLVLCLEIGAPLAIHLIAADKADPAISVLRIQGLAVAATFLSVACGYPLLARSRYRGVLAANVIALVLAGGLTLVLAPSLGARGAAIAAVLAESGLAITEAAMLMRGPDRIDLPFGILPIVGLSAGVAAAGPLVVGLEPILGAAVGSVIFFGVLRLCGRFPDEVRAMLHGRLSTVFGE